MASQAAEAEAEARRSGPIPDHVLNPKFPDNELRERLEQVREVHQDLEFLQNTRDNPYAPYVWGFQIYRAVYGPGSNERFATGLAHLEAWVRWQVRQSRYDDHVLRSQVPDCSPAVGEWDPTDEMAARFQNEVADYPDIDNVHTLTPESQARPEHFQRIGRAFVDWVQSTGIDPSSPVVRYNHCLVVDGLALGTTPKMVFNRIYEYEMAVPVPPWLRLETHWIHSLWFRCSRATMTLEWDSKCQWDQEDPDTIPWWSSNAHPRNQSNYARGVRQTERALRYDQ